MLVWIQSPFDNLPQEGFRRERYWLMAEAFIAAGHQVVYFTANFNHGTKAKRVWVAKEKEGEGVDLHLISVPPYTKNVSLKRVYSHFVYAKRLEKESLKVAMVHRPDLVISATPTLGAAEVMRCLARRCDAKFVIDIQDAWPETFHRLLPRGFTWMGRVFFAGMYRTARRLYRMADFSTGVSERYREISARPDYYLAYHGIDIRHSMPNGNRQPSDVNKLFYLGNLGAGYDLETVIEAVALSSELTLDIAGRGPKEAALKELVRVRRLESRVRFHGYLQAEAIARLASSCGVGVIPMRDDSWVALPYKLGDYLAAGLKVVSSLHGECGDLMVREKVGAVYDFGSAKSLLAALKELEKLPAAKKNLPDELLADSIYPKYVAFVTSPARIFH